MALLRRFFVGRERKQLEQTVAQVNEYESKLEGESLEQLGERSLKLRARVHDGTVLEEVLPEAFALVREAAKRTLNQRHYDVQIIGGIALHEGKIAPMAIDQRNAFVSRLCGSS